MPECSWWRSRTRLRRGRSSSRRAPPIRASKSSRAHISTLRSSICCSTAPTSSSWASARSPARCWCVRHGRCARSPDRAALGVLASRPPVGNLRGPLWLQHRVATLPGAMPGIASPGALLAVVLLTDNDRFSLREETLTGGLTVAVLVLVLIILLLAARIQRYLGAAGIMVITQIMGLVLAAFSVQQILDGALEVFARGAH